MNDKYYGISRTLELFSVGSNIELYICVLLPYGCVLLQHLAQMYAGYRYDAGRLPILTVSDGDIA